MDALDVGEEFSSQQIRVVGRKTSALCSNDEQQLLEEQIHERLSRPNDNASTFYSSSQMEDNVNLTKQENERRNVLK